ncbi:MAG: hypothetical protein EPN91_08765 [Salinibacterium sp.]|nr:MAG: hypothetical protein EPN91_08765 [Salinibacterium sp.]
MSKVETSGTVHFSVQGEFITDTARRLWAEEGEQERALRILRCMQGITEQQILDVLEGRSQLVGWSDSPEGIQLKSDKHKGVTLEEQFKKLKGERYEFDDQPKDIKSKRSTRTGNPPKKQRIYRKMKDSGGISRPKLKRFESSMEGIARMADPGDTNKGFLPAETEREREEREEKEREEKEEEARQYAKANLVVSDTITGDTGWLSPEGKFYPCGYSEHARVIWALGLCGHPQMHGAHPAGWVRLGMNGSEPYVHDAHDSPDPPTKAQKDLISAFCKKRKIKLPWWLEENER